MEHFWVQLFFVAHSFKSVKMSHFKVYDIKMYVKFYICVLRHHCIRESKYNIKYKKTIHLRITMCDSIDFRLHIKLLINIIFSVRQCIIIATFSDKHLLKKYECYRLSSDWNQVYYISSYLHRHSQFQWILCCTNTYNHRGYCYTFHTLYHNHGWRPMHIHWHLPNKYIFTITSVSCAIIKS